MRYPMKRISNRWFTCAKWLVSLLLLVIILLKTDVSSLWGLLRSTNVALVGGAAILILITHYINAVKVARILPEYHPLSIGRLTAINFVGTFLNNLLPTRIGGDVARVFFINKKLASKRVSIAVVLIDRASGIAVQTLLVLFSGAFLSGTLIGPRSKFWCGALFFAGCCVVFLPWLLPSRIKIKSVDMLMRVRLFAAVFKSGPVRSFLNNFFASPGRVAGIVLIGSVFQCFVIVSIIALTRAFGGTISFFESATVCFASTIACFLAPSIGGWGVMEGAFTYLYQFLHLQGRVGLAVSLGLRITVVIPSIIGWVVFMQSGRMKKG